MNKESKILIGLGVVTVVLIVFGSFFFTKAPSNSETQEKVVDNSLLLDDNAYIKGNKDASITIVEFADFECPACAASQTTNSQILNEYGDKVRLVFRHFPLPMHKNAMDAARTSEAAGAQGKFWEMHDMLFEKQEEWTGKNDAVNIFAEYAKELSLDVDQFKKDIADRKFDDRINLGLSEGNAAGVNSTPTYFINGVKSQGVLTYAEFKTRLSEILK